MSMTASATRLSALLPEGAEVLQSSEGLPWNDLLVETYRMHPGERSAGANGWHVISALGSRAATFEESTSRRGFRSFTKPPGAITLIPVGEVPPVRLHTVAELRSCAVSDALLRTVNMEEHDGGEAELLFRTGLRDSAAERIVGLLVDEMEEGAPSGQMYADSLVRVLICRYVALARHGTALRTSAKASLHPRIVRRLHEWMLTHLHQDLSLSAMAKEASYSATHLLRAFRNVTGLTPHQYLLQLRIDKAEAMMRRPNARLIDIASECGFSSQAHFTQVFKSRRGVTPGRFQRELQSTHLSS